jgi:hypothetical protein
MATESKGVTEKPVESCQLAQLQRAKKWRVAAWRKSCASGHQQVSKFFTAYHKRLQIFFQVVDLYMYFMLAQCLLKVVGLLDMFV